jgi:long-chain acyl-CoA synthetase
MPTLRSLPDLFRERVAATPQGEAWRQYVRDKSGDAGRWQSISWAEAGERVARWTGALAAEKLQPGERVAILAKGSIEHVCMDQAVLALGCVPVPLHAIDNPESIAYILSDCGAQLLLVEQAKRWEELSPFRAQFPALRKVLSLDKPASGEAVWIEDWLKASGAAPATAKIDPESLAAIVYTSGTTGKPKGVMLTHANVVSNVEALLKIVEVRTDDQFLSFLPLSHTFERTVGYYTPIAAGSKVAFARSVPELLQDLKDIRPTILVSVPRIYERVYAKLQENPVARLGWWILDKLLVGPKVRAQLGGRLRFAITGGAPMALVIAERFRDLGIEVLQGYGMTEASPVVSANRPGNNDPASVGPPIPGVEVKIGANDELLVKGPNLMKGYLNRPEDTAKAIDKDGWLHTGDQADIREGRIHIKGRIKDIIVTSTGEKIAPADLELAIQADPLFAQSMVIGENKPYIAALLVLDPAHWKKEAASQNLDAAAKKFVLGRIKKAVASFPSYAMPRSVWVTLDPWTVDNGLITPTLKVKRKQVEERFAAEIATLYDKK